MLKEESDILELIPQFCGQCSLISVGMLGDGSLALVARGYPPLQVASMHSLLGIWFKSFHLYAEKERCKKFVSLACTVVICCVGSRPIPLRKVISLPASQRFNMLVIVCLGEIVFIQDPEQLQ